MNSKMDENTLKVARSRVEEWTDEKAGEYIKRNVEVVLCYGHFNPGQDGYNALAMILAFSERHTESNSSHGEKCECHERDSSFVCDHCYSQGLRGHMQS